MAGSLFCLLLSGCFTQLLLDTLLYAFIVLSVYVYGLSHVQINEPCNSVPVADHV